MFPQVILLYTLWAWTGCIWTHMHPLEIPWHCFSMVYILTIMISLFHLGQVNCQLMLTSLPWCCHSVSSLASYSRPFSLPSSYGNRQLPFESDINRTISYLNISNFKIKFKIPIWLPLTAAQDEVIFDRLIHRPHYACKKRIWALAPILGLTNSAIRC